MADQVSDVLVDRISQWDINRIYGINGIMGALERAQDKVEFIQVRHEENAAFMALVKRQSQCLYY